MCLSRRLTPDRTRRPHEECLAPDGWHPPQWNPLWADFLAAIGVTPRVCRAYAPQTKGKVERTIRYVTESFWPGVRFRDLDDLNRHALAWCDRRNVAIHGTTHVKPVDRWVEEVLCPLPTGFVKDQGVDKMRTLWHPSGHG